MANLRAQKISEFLDLEGRAVELLKEKMTSRTGPPFRLNPHSEEVQFLLDNGSLKPVRDSIDLYDITQQGKRYVKNYLERQPVA